MQKIVDYDRRHFTMLARYNRITNDKLFALLATLEAGSKESEFAKERGAYFGSLRGIANHVLACDVHWMRRFREIFGYFGPLAHARLQPDGHVWTKFEIETLEELTRERRVVDGLLEDFAATADTGRFDEVLRYRDSAGTELRFIFRDALSHVFNHQTHHRGQMSQILDELGVEHDFSDLLDCLAPVNP